MTAAALKALKGSIRKWEKIVDGTGIDDATKNCPLCKQFYWDENCEGCPVSDKTGEKYCMGSPHARWEAHQDQIHRMMDDMMVYCPTCLRLAKSELAFLKRLLPKGE